MALSVQSQKQIIAYRKRIVLQVMAQSANDRTTATVGILNSSLQNMQVSKPSPGSILQILNVQA